MSAAAQSHKPFGVTFPKRASRLSPPDKTQILTRIAEIIPSTNERTAPLKKEIACCSLPSGRKAFLLGEGERAGERKDWIENRLKELDAIFGVSVSGFSIMDNHLHLYGTDDGIPKRVGIQQRGVRECNERNK